MTKNKEKHNVDKFESEQIFFTVRDKKIRIISARDQCKKEREFYQAIEKKWKDKNVR